ncbi:MAG: peroxiredoxin [Alphaproteobacteria bacterium]|nr:peroxiredoxin [Alphaproteobacteria bacterium]MCZ6606981.1 peroxiredoxin [Alphaproteobacteria bacterium]
MTIQVGDTIPSATLNIMTADGPSAITTDDIFKGKTVALFGLPGAFTPTCSAQHLPGFVANADALNAKGVDSIVCLAVNDVFVMGAWGKDQNVGDKVTLVADGSAAFTKAAGLELDLTERGLGLRCQRFSMVVDDGVVKSLNIDPAGSFEATSAEKILEQL